MRQWIEEITETISCEWSLKNIILNKVHPKSSHVVNLITVLTKQLIYSAKCKQEQLTLQSVKTEVYLTEQLERYHARATKKLRFNIVKRGTIIRDYEQNSINDIIDNYLEKM